MTKLKAWGSINYWLVAVEAARQQRFKQVGAARALLMMLISEHPLSSSVAAAMRGLRHAVSRLPKPEDNETLGQWSERAGIPTSTPKQVRTAYYLSSLKAAMSDTRGKEQLH